MASTAVPPSLRPIAHYVKIANENAARDPVVYYWCLFYAVQTGMSIDKSSSEALTYLTSLLSTLEGVKKQLAGQEALTQDMVAQAHIENFAMKLFEYADKNDRQSNFSKNVVKSFYTAGHLIDVLTLFGELDDSLVATRKYSKWKATYIHNCLKNGETPVPGPAGGLDEEELDLDVPVIPNATGGAIVRDGGSVPGTHAGMAEHPPAEKPSAPARNLPPPPASPHDSTTDASSSAGNSALTMEDYLEAQKHAKYAVSALSYEDAKTAIESMQKAIAVLTKYN